jgi:CRISPR/Cas system-associated endonuclease Cas1
MESVPALALDLAEEFGPLVADSLVINLINNGEIKQDTSSCEPGEWL